MKKMRNRLKKLNRQKKRKNLSRIASGLKKILVEVLILSIFILMRIIIKRKLTVINKNDLEMQKLKGKKNEELEEDPEPKDLYFDLDLSKMAIPSKKKKKKARTTVASENQ